VNRNIIIYPWRTAVLEEADDIDGPPEVPPHPPSPLPPSHWARIPRVGGIRRDRAEDERTNCRRSSTGGKPS
jgi:hypothetical protein